MLRRETEALGLAEVGDRLRRRDVRHRLRHSVVTRQVVSEEVCLVQLAGMHAHGAHDRVELPATDAWQLSEKVDGDRAVQIRLFDDGGASERLLITNTGDAAQHVVQRNERETEAEAPGGEDEQLQRETAMRAHRDPRITDMAMKPT